jgi:hypothetical protein
MCLQRLLPRSKFLNATLMSFERFMLSLMTVVVLVFDLHARFLALDPKARSERSCAQRSSELAPEWLLQSVLDTILHLLTKFGCSIAQKGTLASMPLTLVWPLLSTSTSTRSKDQVSIPAPKTSTVNDCRKAADRGSSGRQPNQAMIKANISVYPSMHAQLEQALALWFGQQEARDLAMTSRVLKNKKRGLIKP